MDIKASCIYTSCACNKSPRALDWGTNGVIAYGACCAVHLLNYEKNNGASHLQTLIGHKKIVTSVHWIQASEFETELISTSADFTAILWSLQGSEYVNTAHLTGHTNVVRNACGIYLPMTKDDLLIATLSTDSSVKIWFRSQSQTVSCIQTISFGNGFALDVKIAILNKENELIMLLGGDDDKIHLYLQNDSNQFFPVLKLHGHEDWIHSLDVLKESENSLLLASGSQDSYIRMWKISKKLSDSTSDNELDLKTDETIFSSKLGHKYSILLESVLSGHENWIYSVKWKHCKRGPFNDSKVQILSASMDKTMIIWELDSSSNIWTEKVRVGEVGGNTLGFYGGVFSPCGEIIIAHGYQGAIHVWQLDETGIWQPGLSFGGHYSSVQDIDWDTDGEYLLSCSLDQTTRLHAPFVSQNAKKWYEVARPQVHGYDMTCLSVLNRYKFVSAGDEKVLRVFEAPRSFAETLENLSKIDTSLYMKQNLAEGASVPSLGLSNKAVFPEDLKNISLSDEPNSFQSIKDNYPEFYYTPMTLTAPPTEETLLQNTLWPESQKLYGHPYEVFAVASNHSSTIIASACKASKYEHAGIILWNSSTWKQLGTLLFHNLTVTQLEFSPDDEYLLSVSRDRMWAVYRSFPDQSPPYQKIASLDKKNSVHSRIIWSCSWTFDSLFFATASRDKKVAVWGKIAAEKDEFLLSSKALEVEDSATAISFAPSSINNRYIFAVGLESGCIILGAWSKELGFAICATLKQNIAHHMNVNRLRFSPTAGEAGSKNNKSNMFQLSSCSSDNHVKIYNVSVELT
ncbi:elongator complex protein 2-like [Uloborus diversus]|uniref:elongator complex protein 2-like n=1 Tax=Uloborus diversus TaxID=327109 RepID=UPI00240A6EEE|nr:elongator complex protein 2-like [Uloborus diversus]